jgi:selenocysteine-specific elongation factor
VTAPALVVGTSGHVDHGKTSLVRALTGLDLDDLPEERERGITIALGFAPLDLPDGRRLALIDVPGHERLVRTMIAGASGMDAAVLCVSAVEGVMPQTREHLAILELLGVRTGIVVLTFADLAEPDLLDLVHAEVEDLVQGTFLSGCPVIPCSAVTGEGVPAVLGAIGALPAMIRAPTGVFRMPVDRVFSLPGFGTIATGTVQGGSLREGASVTIAPHHRSARVRSLQVHGQKVSEVRAGWRAALNLAGVEVADVGRGDVVVSGVGVASAMVDVDLHILNDAPALPDGAPVRLLVGTAEAYGKIYLVSPGDEIEPGRHLAQLRLDGPIVAWPGDRFVLRRQSPIQTLGGGVILDPWAPKMRPRSRARVADELRALRAGDRSVLLLRAGDAGWSTGEAEQRGVVGIDLGGRIVHPQVVVSLEDELVQRLHQYHRDRPLAAGAGRREVKQGRLAGLSDRAFEAVIARVRAAGRVADGGAVLKEHGFEPTTTGEQAWVASRLLDHAQALGVEGLGRPALVAAFPRGDAEDLVRWLERRGELVEVPGLGWAHPAVAQTVQDKVRHWFLDHDALGPVDFKALIETSRKAAIPWLEWLDLVGLTKREGDVRRRGPVP